MTFRTVTARPVHAVPRHAAAMSDGDMAVVDRASSTRSAPAITDYGVLTLSEWLAYWAARARARRTVQRARRASVERQR